MGKNIHMAAPVLLKLFSAQTHNSSIPAEPTTWPTAKPFFLKMTTMPFDKHFSGCRAVASKQKLRLSFFRKVITQQDQ
jgi:hypothetical protein